MGKLATVYYGMPVDAGMVKALLSSHGIPVFLEDERMAGLLPQAVGPGGAGPVKVDVAVQDFRKAKHLIQVYFKGEASIPFEDLAAAKPPPKTVRRKGVPGSGWLDLPTCLVLLAVAAVILARSFYAAHYVKHFRHLRLDGRRALAGSFPIPADFAGRTLSFRFSYDLRGRPKTVDAMAHGSLASEPVLGAARVVIRYGPSSETRTLEDEKGAPAYWEGVHAARLEFDDARRAGSLTNLGEDGRPAEDAAGVARQVWELDAAGRIARIFRLNRRGDRIVDGLGAYETRLRYDEAGNKVEQSNLSPDGQLLEDKDGVAVTRWAYDEYGEVSEVRRYDAQDRLARARPGAAPAEPAAAPAAKVAGQRFKYNSLGDVVQKESFDADGQPAEDSEGVATTQMVYDEHGNLTEQRFFGADAKPRASRSEGASVVRWSYGRDGRMVRRRAFDARGRLVDKKDYGPKVEPPYAPPFGSL